ncbi:MULTISPECIES: hypothetical protein [Novosphingobium]|uniref:hypothetical protein n=1 Tax=Novosphingobium TaxID=165696 RepID=UPI0022F28215|nr:hypothetical protein [Novosphingobium resinovorum]GLK44461.1 hypothetical protein GCM10017612_23810 [Novosphingobium resinovorum]
MARTANHEQLTCDLTIDGKAEASEDVIGGGISLKNHKHTGRTRRDGRTIKARIIALRGW